MNQEVKERIAELLDVDVDVLCSDKLLEEIDDWDSVAALGLMVILGEHIGGAIAPGELKNLATFGDIELLVASKLR